MNLLLWILLFLLLFLIGIICCYWWISLKANTYLYNSVEILPHRQTALLLGTAKYTTERQPNLFFSNRIAKVIAVYNQNKTDKILVSGADKIPQTLDEADLMCQSLLNLGVLPEAIIEDHKGNRTWNSILRCKLEFKIKDPLIVSQRFHNQRAVFIALKMGMQPIAVNADKVAGHAGIKIILREALARVKCLMDCYLLHPNIQ